MNPGLRSVDARERPTAVVGRGARTAVFALALATRIVYQAAVVGEQAPPQDDAAQYDSIAWSVAQGGDFVTQDGLRSHRAPGYPLLLAGVYAGFGHHWSIGRLVQALMGLCPPSELRPLEPRSSDRLSASLPAWRTPSCLTRSTGAVISFRSHCACC